MGTPASLALVGETMSATNQSYMSGLQERLTVLRSKLNDPSQKLSKEAVLVLTTELQPIYKKLLMADLDNGVQRQLENFMWNDCFKKPLTYFMKVDKTLFHFMIESGVGFYLGFIQNIGMQFDVSFIKNSSKTLLNSVPKMKDVLKCSPSKSVVYYVIQNSLVHVGDLLRYRGSFAEAMKMYEKSTSVSPTNGHPFNQMGLVQLLIDDKSMDSLVTGVYCYARAGSVANPFIPAQQNLEGLLAKAKTTQPSTEVEQLLHTFLITIDGLISNSLKTTYMFDFATCFLTIDILTYAQLFRVMIIALWAWKRESDKGLLGIDTNDEGRVLELIAALLNGILGAIKEFQDAANLFALAHLNIMLEWIRLYPSVLANPSFRKHLNVNLLCLVANKLVPQENKFICISNELSYVILPEEKKLLGFLPSTKAYEHLLSVMDEADPRGVALRVIRFIRLIQFLAEPRFGVIKYTNNEYKEIPYRESKILRLSNSKPRQNMALQSIFNQLTKTMEAEAEADLDKKKSKSKGQGLLSTALARALEKEKETTQNLTYVFDELTETLEKEKETTPSQNLTVVFQELATEGTRIAPQMDTPELSNYSSESSPTPFAMSSSTTTPTHLNTDFSQLFKSIWTPLGNENALPTTEDGAGPNSIIWKF